MRYEILPPADKVDVEYKSSAYQHRNKFAVWAGGEYRPIAFDEILGIDCGHIETRRVVVTDGYDSGFNYEVGHCHYYSDIYPMFDHREVVTEELPEWFGMGFYQRAVDEYNVVNTDTGSVGERNKHNLAVGLNYAVAKDTLPAVE